MGGRKLSGRESRMWSRVTNSVSKIERELEPHAENVDKSIGDSTDDQKKDDKQKYIPKRATERDLKKLASERFSPGLKTPDPVQGNVKRSGLADRAHEKRVRRGRVPYGGTLDLHGHTQETGRAALLTFLKTHRDLGDRSILVITGKGRAGEGVLRRRLLEWIEQSEFRRLVSGYSRANQKHGGDGAFYLFLRRIND